MITYLKIIITILPTIQDRIGDNDSSKDCGIDFGCFSFMADLNSLYHESCSSTFRGWPFTSSGYGNNSKNDSTNWCKLDGVASNWLNVDAYLLKNGWSVIKIWFDGNDSVKNTKFPSQCDINDCKNWFTNFCKWRLPYLYLHLSKNQYCVHIE